MQKKNAIWLLYLSHFECKWSSLLEVRTILTTIHTFLGKKERIDGKRKIRSSALQRRMRRTILKCYDFVASPNAIHCEIHERKMVVDPVLRHWSMMSTMTMMSYYSMRLNFLLLDHAIHQSYHRRQQRQRQHLIVAFHCMQSARYSYHLTTAIQCVYHPYIHRFHHNRCWWLLSLWLPSMMSTPIVAVATGRSIYICCLGQQQWPAFD